MRILLHAWGSRGDVQPMIALGRGLTARGHEVAVAAASDFEAMVTAHGLGFEPVEVDLDALSSTEVGRGWLGGEARDQREELRLMGRFLALAAEPLAAMLVRTRDRYERMVTNPVLLESAMMLSPGVPVTCALLQPSIATRDARSTISAVRPGRSVRNLVAGALAGVGVRPLIASIAQATARAAGLRRPSWRGYYRGLLGARYLLASSPLVTPDPGDWSVPVSVTGFWQLPNEAFEPGAALADFLAAGEAPIYLGFGSMSSRDAAASTELVGRALEIAGVRAVVRPGLADLAVASGRVQLVDDVPHSWLFPRMAACVHHGGAGTTAAALAAGVPQVVVPHMGDQPFWARRMHELGVAAAPLPRRTLTADDLAQRIVASLALGEQAARLGVQVAAENGVGRAVDALEETFAADEGRGAGQAQR